MRRLPVRRAPLLGAISIVLLCLGCAGGGGSGNGAGSPGDELPQWVRIVPHSQNGERCFVGAALSAVDAETGIEMATGDAHLQIAKAAGERVKDLYTAAVTGSGIVVPPQDRVALRGELSNNYAERMESPAREENVYYRPCEEDSGDDGGPVCDIFVLVSVDEDTWDRELSEALLATRKERGESAATPMLGMIDWMLRAHGEGAVGQQDERDRGRDHKQE